MYQRLLAGDHDEAAKLVEKQFAHGNLLEVYDNVLLPALAMVEQDSHRFWRDAVDGFAIAHSEVTEKMLHQQWQVLLSLSQWRKNDGNDVQSIEQVFAEFSCGYFFSEVFIGGCQDANVYTDTVISANRGDFVLL